MGKYYCPMHGDIEGQRLLDGHDIPNTARWSWIVCPKCFDEWIRGHDFIGSNITYKPKPEIILECCGKPESKCSCGQPVYSYTQQELEDISLSIRSILMRGQPVKEG